MAQENSHDIKSLSPSMAWFGSGVFWCRWPAEGIGPSPKSAAVVSPAKEGVSKSTCPEMAVTADGSNQNAPCAIAQTVKRQNVGELHNLSQAVKALIEDSYDAKSAIYRLLLEVQELRNRIKTESVFSPTTIRLLSPKLAREFGVDPDPWPLSRLG